MDLGKTNPYGKVHLAFAHDQPSGEFWAVVSDEPTCLQTFAQYRLRFQIEECFLDIKSSAFDLEASRLRQTKALSRLCAVVALTMLFLTLQGTYVVASDLRRQVDPHWQRGMSYLKLGWQWILLALARNWKVPQQHTLSGQLDPEPAQASKKQAQRLSPHEFTISRWKSPA